MKILFVLDNLSYKCGANVNILINIVEHLAVKNEVHAFIGYDRYKPIDCKKEEYFKKVYKVKIDNDESIKDFLILSNWSRKSKRGKIVAAIKNPKSVYYMLDYKYFDNSETYKLYRKSLKKICSEEAYDIVFGCSEPYYILRAVSKLNIDILKVAFQLDPYTYNYTKLLTMLKRRRKIEKNTIEKLDILFATSFVYDEICEKNISNQRDKIVSFELPGIKMSSKEQYERFEDNNVHFIFVGQFYKDIRNPKYMLELFEKLPSNYILHIVGGGCETLVEEYTQRLGKRLINHGWVSREEAFEFMEKADILVNLNNAILNQLPSKVFEYISTGKPILNICKTEKCLSLKYTSKYANCFDVIENQFEEEGIQRIKKFVIEKKGTLVDKEAVFKNFREHTDEYLAELVEKKLRKLCEIKNGKK